MDVYKLPIAASLGIIAGILALSISASLLRPGARARELDPRPGISRPSPGDREASHG